MHSQACFLSYQLQDIHISLLWCSQPNRNTEMEPLLSFYIVLSFSFSPQFLLNFHFLNRGYWFTPFSLSKVIYLLLSHLSPMSYYTHVSLLHFPPPTTFFTLSLSPFCTPPTPGSERPIRLHRGFTGWDCEGKPKWNAVHLLEWNQDRVSSITPYALLGLLLLQLHCNKKPHNSSSKLVWISVCLFASHYLHMHNTAHAILYI